MIVGTDPAQVALVDEVKIQWKEELDFSEVMQVITDRLGAEADAAYHP